MSDTEQDQRAEAAAEFAEDDAAIANGEPEQADATQDPVDATQDPVVADALKRIEKAYKGFAWLNQSRRDGQGGYAPPPMLDLLATIDALMDELVDRGLVEIESVARRKMVKIADALEEALAGAKEHKAAQTGLIVPSGAAKPPGDLLAER